MPASQFLVLASGSKTRKKMLENAGIAITVSPPVVDEGAIKESLISEGVRARDIADALAEAKARTAAYQHPDSMVLAADQILALDEKIFSKAKTREDAVAALKLLSGKKHKLVSAAVVYEQGQPVWRHVDEAVLTVRPLSDAFIDQYLDRLGDDAFWSVGCYQLEGLGAQLFEKIEGDYFTILGLPLLPLLDFLRRRSMLQV